MLIESLYGWQHRARQQVAACLYRLRQGDGRRHSSPPTKLRFDRVLLVIAGLIGDTVMSVPVIIEARRLWPNARITVLGQEHNCELLAACPLVDVCVSTSALPFSLRKTTELRRLQQWLKEERFDVALLVLGDQFALMAAKAGIPVRVGAREGLLAPCLTHRYTVGAPQDWGPAERLNALRCLGLDVHGDVSPRVWLAKEAQESARAKLAGLGLSPNEHYFALHPFGSTRRQWWPAERVSRFCARLGEELGKRTVIVGGLDTRSHVPQDAGKWTINTAGLLSVQELSAVLANAKLVVSTDSGPFHIAGALGRPTIGLFRRRRPEHSTRYPAANPVIGDHPGCQTRCKWDNCAYVPCRQVMAISEDDVLVAARGMEKEEAYA